MKWQGVQDQARILMAQLTWELRARALQAEVGQQRAIVSSIHYVLNQGVTDLEMTQRVIMSWLSNAVTETDQPVFEIK